MTKLDQLNSILSRSPFRAIHQSGEYKFYDSRTWLHHTPPDYDEVIGTTISDSTNLVTSLGELS